MLLSRSPSRLLLGVGLGLILVSSLSAGAAAAVVGALGLAPGASSPAAVSPSSPGSPVASVPSGPASSITPLVVTPALTVTPSTGYPGENVSFSGTNFPKNQAFNVTYPGSSGTTVACGGKTTATGTFTCPFSIHPHPAGTITFTATVTTKTAVTNFTVVSSLSVLPSTGSVGTTITFTGVGFSGNGTGLPVSTTHPAVPAVVNWSGGVACNGTVSSLGKFTCSYLMPATFEGPHVFTASDAVPGDTTTTLFFITPRVVAGPAYAPVGGRVTLIGTGFAAVSPVKVTWKGNASSLGTACLSNTSGVGGFSCAFTIPVGTVGGPYTFTATDGAGNNATAAFSVTYLIVVASTATVGTIVRFTAFAFTPNSTFHIAWSAGTICPGTTNATGVFTCNLTVPPTPVGVHTFTATDGAGLSATTNLTIVPSAAVSPTGGMPSTTVKFTGEGYASGSLVQVSSSLGKACNNTSAANGSFACSYKIPAGAPGGIYVFNATDGLLDTATADFVVTFLKGTSASGPVGTVVQFTAEGFAASSAIKISWSGGNISTCTGTTTTQGTFTCTFTVPSTPGGVHLFTARDAAGNNARTSFVVVPQLTVSPINTTVGGTLSFLATGFAASSTINVTWSGGTLCHGATSVSGQFNCTVKAPATPSGGYVITGVDGSNDSSATTLTILPALTVTPNAGPVGTAVTFKGTGFSASASVTVSWSGGAVCTTTTSSLGNFSCNYTIPSVIPGSKVFTAIDASSRSASTPFTVNPALSASPASGPVNTAITFRGTGFSSNATVTVSWSNGFACSGTSDATGRFACSYTIIPAPAGSHKFTATDSAHSSSANFTITPLLVLSPASGRIGTSFTLTGSGFGASSPFAITWVRGAVCNGTTSVTGSFACSYKIPTGTSGGPATFTATDALRNSANAPFLVTPVLAASPASGPVGTAVTFSGAGFAPTSPASVAYSGGYVCNTTTNATGGFRCPFIIPPLTNGAHTFTATSGGANSTTVFTVVAALALTPSFGPPGTAIVFHGTGFAASSSTTVTSSPSLGAICVNTTLANGNFTCSYTIPLGTSGGNYTFTATDSAPHNASAPFTVSFLHASPTTAIVGTIVTFTGAGFNPGVTYTVTWRGGSAVCSGVTTVNGTIANCTFRLTATAAGPYTFKAQDRTGLAASTVVTVIPAVSATPTSGPVGTVIALQGTGFAANSTITVTGIGSAMCSTGTNTVGSFSSCNITIPSGTAAGTYTLTAKDGSGNTATVSVDVTPTLTDSPSGGPAGTTVTFTGSGYAPGSPITVVWTAGTICSATTNASGGFTCSPKIPLGTAGGAYLFTATDSAPHSASTMFTVTFVASSPSSGVAGTMIAFSGGGFHASSPVSVTWSSGAACSGTSNVSGGFGCSFMIPTSTSLGLYTFTAKDGSGSSANTSFDVLGTPSVSVPLGSRTSADINQSVTFNTTATGGSGRYSTYTWTESSANLGCTLVNAAKITCTPRAVGNYTVTVNVTDSNGITSPSVTSATVEVFTDPTLSPVFATRTAADVGQAVAFNVTAIGGTHVYSTYTWTVSSSGIGCTIVNANAIDCVPTANGSYTVSVFVRDSNGVSSSLVTSARVTVSLAPTVLPPTANHPSVDIGQAVTFSVTTTPGAGGLKYVWNELPTNCSSTLGSFSCTPSAANASLTITVTVTDANGFSVTSGPLAFTVYKDPAVSTPFPVRSKPYDVGQTVTFNVTISSVGSGGLKYTWVGLPKGCTAANASSITCPSLQDGTTNVTVQVVDTNGVTVTSRALEFTVFKDPSVSTPHPSRSSADVGQTLTLTVTVTNGAGSPSYLWSGLPAGCIAANASSISCPSLTTADPYSTMVMVTDASGFTNTSAALGFTVDSDPTITTPVGTHTQVDVNQGVNLSTTAKGGSGGLKYTWNGLPPGCTLNLTPSIVNCGRLTTAGTFSVSANVTDSNGYTATSGVFTITVYSLPSVSLSASTTSFLEGKSVTFTAVVTGGAPGKYNYTWSHLPSGCVSVNAPSLSCTPTASGTFNVTVTASDTNQGRGSATAPIDVQSSFLGLPASEGYLVVTGVVLAGLAVITVFVVRWGLRRKKARSREQLY
jgi:hypothetical protein